MRRGGPRRPGGAGGPVAGGKGAGGAGRPAHPRPLRPHPGHTRPPGGVAGPARLLPPRRLGRGGCRKPVRPALPHRPLLWGYHPLPGGGHGGGGRDQAGGAGPPRPGL